MTKAFEMMRAGLEEALAYAEGKADLSKYRVHVPEKIDVKGLRTSLGLTQDEFAQRFLFTAARVKDWEQGRSSPDSSTRAYLTVIERDTKAVDRALRGAAKEMAVRHSAGSVKEIIKRASANKARDEKASAPARKRA